MAEITQEELKLIGFTIHFAEDMTGAHYSRGRIIYCKKSYRERYTEYPEGFSLMEHYKGYTDSGVGYNGTRFHKFRVSTIEELEIVAKAFS